MDDCLAAKRVLDDGNSCVLCYKGMVFTNNKKSLLPLMEFLDSKFDFSMFSSASNYVDLHHAMFYVKLGIKNIYADKLTKPAKELFDKYSFTYHFKELVDFSINAYEYQLYELVKDITDIDLGIKLLEENIKETKEV